MHTHPHLFPRYYGKVGWGDRGSVNEGEDPTSASQGAHTQNMDSNGISTNCRIKLGDNIWCIPVGSLGGLKVEKGTWIRIIEWQLAVKTFLHFHRCKD